MMLDRVQSYIEGAKEEILKEMKPTQSQIEHGLELHREVVVVDAYGSAGLTNWRAGLYSEPMTEWTKERLDPKVPPEERKAVADAIRRELVRWKALEFGNDTEVHAGVRKIWDSAGVTVGIDNIIPNTMITTKMERVSGEYWYLFLKAVSRAAYIYDSVDSMVKLNDLDGLDELKAGGKAGIIWHMSDADIIFDLNEDDEVCRTGGSFLMHDPIENLNFIYGLGFRSSQLVNSRANRVACGHHAEIDTGLTDIGHDVVKHLNHLGMIIDMSHSGPQTILDTVKASDDPVIATHMACRSLSVGGKSKNRNITDEGMKAIVDRGGLVGITLAPNLLGGFGYENFARHLDYAVGLIGADHVCIGTDTGLIGPAGEPPELQEYEKPEEMQQAKTSGTQLQIKDTRQYWNFETKPQAMSWTNWPYWTSVGMVCRGYSDDDIRKIISGNFIRVAGGILKEKPRGELI